MTLHAAELQHADTSTTTPTKPTRQGWQGSDARTTGVPNRGAPNRPSTHLVAVASAAGALRDRALRIFALLERWHELQDPHRVGAGGEQGLALMPHGPGCPLFAGRRCACYRASVAELERCLRELRNERLNPTAWWHLREFFGAEERVLVVDRPRLDKHGRVRRGKQGKVLMEKRRIVGRAANNAEMSQVLVGVDLLAGLWDPRVSLLLPGPGI